MKEEHGAIICILQVSYILKGEQEIHSHPRRSGSKSYSRYRDIFVNKFIEASSKLTSHNLYNVILSLSVSPQFLLGIVRPQNRWDHCQFRGKRPAPWTYWGLLQFVGRRIASHAQFDSSIYGPLVIPEFVFPRDLLSIILTSICILTERHTPFHTAPICQQRFLKII